jgi:magnesium chelatase family protein
VKCKELAQDGKSEESSAIRERILAARHAQCKHLESFGTHCNSQMSPRMIHRFCKLDADSGKQIENAIVRLGLLARAYDRILHVARTMADLEGIEKIQARHVSEAMQYRSLDRTYWQ